MKKYLQFLTAVAACLACMQIQAAVSVTVGGTTPQAFGAVPVAADWSTLSITGAPADVTDAAGLDAAVQLLASSGITTTLGSSGTQPPTINGLARWNSAGLFLQTRPAQTSKMVVLMATLQNNSGATISTLRVDYDLGATNNPAGAVPLGEEVPGLRAYYSLSGAAGSWVFVPALSVATAGHLSADLSLGSWTVGSTLFVLWADDNGSGADVGAVGTTAGEGTYTIDNFSAGASEPISVGPSGTGTLTFDTYPLEAQWSTATIPGGAGDLGDAAAVDAGVQTIPASFINATLGSSGTVGPPSANAIARWNTVNHDLQLRPTGVRGNVLLATLRNDTGAAVSALGVSYTLAVETEGGVGPVSLGEEVPGQRVFYSLTGSPGDWHVIPELSSGALGPNAATLNLGSWAPSALLYILWADDNGTGGTTAGTTPYEGAYRLDNFQAQMATVGVTITSPANDAMIPEGVSIPITAAIVMQGNITSVDFFENGNPLGTLTGPPYSVVYSGATLGAHSLTATAHDDLANTATSPAVNITIVPNNPPTVTLTTGPASPVLVGLNVTNTAAASDSDGSVVRVEFYVDAVLRFTDTTSPYTFEYCDPTAGTHILSAVAVDNAAYRGTNTLTLVVTNPPDISVLVANGSIWKYLDDGSDQGTAWREPSFVDAAWSSGPAELGYGDLDQNRPPVTTVGFGPNAATKYPTTYFRHQFTVANPSDYTNLIIRLLRDDGGIVYINGVEVFRSYMTNGVYDYLTLAGLAGAGPAATDDGTVYQETSTNPSVLVVGDNTLAVEIHQDAVTSSDISFDLMLWGQKDASGPLLSILNTGTEIRISWSDPANNYKLQHSDDLSSPANWGDVPGDPGSPVVLTLPVSPNSRFFQLKHR